MQRIAYCILQLFSRLPLTFLYRIADIITFLNYRIIKYRKKVIRHNLRQSFPNKSREQLKTIEKQYFSNFSDYMVETTKGITISQEELNTRLTLNGLEHFNTYAQRQQNVVMLLGHVFNWEWFIGVNNKLPTQYNYAVYKPARNAFWNEKINHERERLGSIAISSKKVLRKMMEVPPDGNHLFFFVADQSPYKSKITYELPFLHQETPIFLGFDKIITRKNYGVIYCEMIKTGRGYYTINFKPLTPKGEKWEPFEVAHQFYHELEQTIYHDPANWLWSHKRWKYKKGRDY